ncbi:hypothetical protein CXB51_034627 [Gossypium anomalum]|uniref:HAT C-terminal dimerisation domain-containing protein n=1 Tax=Gossypium anomalum TaxID=47600 RepID=A0A8J5Y2A8_9ROSI|nr:hypothetical protein CXB51_034627 [Gossypium anomalum]
MERARVCDEFKVSQLRTHQEGQCQGYTNRVARLCTQCESNDVFEFDRDIVASKEVILICQNFPYLTCKIKLVASSSNQHYQLRDIETSNIAKLIDSGELEISKGKNQISTLQRLRDTRWESHLAFLNSSVRMFSLVCVVLQDIIKSVNLTQRSEADGIHGAMTSVEFVFIFHFTIEMLGLLQKFREHGWDPLFEEVKLFCKDHEIEVPNLNALYKIGRGRSRIQRDNLTIEHHHWFDIFIVGTDSLLTEMNSRFNDEKASTVANLGQVLTKTNKSSIYPLPDRIIHLVLTLPVSTAKTERAFSDMKIVKTRLRQRMEDDFLLTYLVAYIEKEIAREFLTNSIIDGFELTKKRKVQFRIPSIEK